MSAVGQYIIPHLAEINSENGLSRPLFEGLALRVDEVARITMSLNEHLPDLQFNLMVHYKDGRTRSFLVMFIEQAALIFASNHGIIVECDDGLRKKIDPILHRKLPDRF